MIGTKISKSDFDGGLYAECAVWCNANNAIIEDKGDYYEVSAVVKSLEKIKTCKIDELKAARDAEEVQPIEYGDHVYDYDSKARDRMAVAIIALESMGADASISWTTADNEDAVVTAKDLRAISTSVANRSNALHVKYRKLKERVLQCTEAKEIEAVKW